jgi:hypothetical protein
MVRSISKRQRSVVRSQAPAIELVNNFPSEFSIPSVVDNNFKKKDRTHHCCHVANAQNNKRFAKRITMSAAR